LGGTDPETLVVELPGKAIERANTSEKRFNLKDIRFRNNLFHYQMHGLVVDEAKNYFASIIWCDSVPLKLAKRKLPEIGEDMNA
jgi:hypothetical protein